MLSSLHIENFAIIDQVTIGFTSTMTVLSGETGAGKSIIIDALGILCGGRGSVDLIRKGTDRFVVEGIFTVQHNEMLLTKLDQLGFDTRDQENQLLIRRELNIAGKNTIRINGQLANVSLLKEIGRYLVDIHGQNEHQALLDVTTHIKMLDQYASEALGLVFNQFRQSYHTYNDLRKKLLNTQQDEQSQAQRLSFLEFQLQELEGLQIQLGEDEELQKQSKQLQHAQQITQNLDRVNLLLTDQDQSVAGQMDQVVMLLEELSPFDPQYQEYAQSIQSLQIDLQEIARKIAFSYDLPDYDDATIDEIESRLSQLEHFKRKYAMDLEELVAYQDSIAEEIYQINHKEAFLEDLKQEFTKAYQECMALAIQMSQIRQEQGKQLKEEIEEQLSQLYMPHSRFDIHFESVKVDDKISKLMAGQEFLRIQADGMDLLEFYAATNLGESSKSLIKVASGGELSRFMLALKTVFSRSQSVQTIVFDEIDSGVSGRVATAIANKMSEIAAHRQVLCITHLPQVAAAANNQLMIAKKIVEDRTVTAVYELTHKERIETIARMMAGETISQSSYELANELLSSYH
ncbi:DNA repair protein RecN [Facklamia sp. DSM 111018]|uniref:DNA repair protein RecN n=1 Tax=Facklamia lactis TaxID=2749967 RepID=A0ABS0LR78_9LACT|nr:DNA repair protein RecN [Facklamia lactis]MBG9980983.1 DNA repair protein RecN [Facklamia lactis]MBG9986654.1 DNA repair protein RecN [Facklamia lactis]